ncbi:S-adenosyl-l-methionine-dependent methyltransferases superfamily protein [Thalictrum thalictroides]|uniref:Methyltransferase n=1 Tax=Thalictrum thalictroides TaxID=46969 RepID=A0A7J6X4H1_THATH|nr:S-adenosyl-l-methionine-dependent methyltransferases superfamily protein [Thalictrum thalictroides]
MFATALIDLQLDSWVIKVVPVSGPNTLPVIYDRGLIGVMHDWCEPFDTYPRTYELLHASGLFTVEKRRRRCFTRIHHRNLAQFLGYCQEEAISIEAKNILVTNSCIMGLSRNLYGPLTREGSINWIKRLEIVEDDAKAKYPFLICFTLFRLE